MMPITTSPLRFAVLAGAFAASITAQSETSLATAELELAKQAKKDSRVEACMMHIQRARQHLESAPKPDAKLRKDIDKYARTIDHRDPARRNAMRKAAKSLLKVCELYIQKGWLEVAGPLLSEAQRLDPASARVTRGKLAEARNTSTGTGALAEMFSGGELIWGTGDWKFDGETLTAPEYDKSKVLMIGDRRLRFDTEGTATSVEFQATGPVDLRLVFAYRHVDEYCMVRLQSSGGDKAKIEVLRQERAKEIVITSKSVALTKTDDGWHRLGFRCDGENIHASVGASDVLETAIPVTPLRGFLGLMLLGTTQENAAVSFRHLRMEGFE